MLQVTLNLVFYHFAAWGDFNKKGGPLASQGRDRYTAKILSNLISTAVSLFAALLFLRATDVNLSDLNKLAIALLIISITTLKEFFAWLFFYYIYKRTYKYFFSKDLTLILDDLNNTNVGGRFFPINWLTNKIEDFNPDMCRSHSKSIGAGAKEHLLYSIKDINTNKPLQYIDLLRQQKENLDSSIRQLVECMR